MNRTSWKNALRLGWTTDRFRRLSQARRLHRANACFVPARRGYQSATSEEPMYHSTSNTTLRSTSTDPNRILGQQSGRSFGIVSSFPPTACGIATFSAALAAGLIANGHTVDVVRCEASLELEDPLVLASLGDRSPVGGPLADGATRSQANAIDVLNRTDVVILQHEYGLYDGADGAAVLDLMAQITVPVIVVAHTVVTNPTPGQRRVLEQLCDGAGTVVVMTLAARDRLLAGFETDGAKIIVVPHGAATPPSDLLDQTQLTDPASTRVTGEPPRLQIGRAHV